MLVNGLIKQGKILKGNSIEDFKVLMRERKQELKQLISNISYKNGNFLIRELASFQIAVEYERLYQLISKSQIELLQRLRLFIDAMSREILQEHYEELAKKNSQEYSNYSFDK